jgi:hypothetical protein
MYICHSVVPSVHKLTFRSYISNLEYINKMSYTYLYMAFRFLRLICILLQYNPLALPVAVTAWSKA